MRSGGHVYEDAYHATGGERFYQAQWLAAGGASAGLAFWREFNRESDRSGDPTMIELDTLAARLDARLAELNDREAELEHETRNPACDLATKAEQELETVRALQEEVRRIREWVFHLQRHRE
jgi:hypothetical protein